MKKTYLIKNPIYFQGEKYLNTNENYFEGWYFKNSNTKETIAFIPGINLNNKEKKAFIQVITNNHSYFINYDIELFEYNDEPFFIKIGDNFFSETYISINIKDELSKLNIYGEIEYQNQKNIHINLLNPNIMGPFSYLKSMDCNHAILSMKSIINGKININNKRIIFQNNNGYIEKDWGISFPKNYIWLQGNNFKNKNASFMLSIANIPFKCFNFKGLICSLIVDNLEYRFATYNNSKIVKYEIDNNNLNIIIKKGKYQLEISSKLKQGLKLSAPVKGKMIKDIYESVASIINITLKENNKILFKDTSKNCGLEIVSE